MIESPFGHTKLPPVPPPLPSTTSSVAPVPTVSPGSDPIYQELHITGLRALWVVTVLMAISSLVFYVLAARAQLSKRLFHTLISLSATISFVVYLAMATGQGVVWKHDRILEQHKHVPDTAQHYFRQVFWLRYVNWFLTEPLLLINLAVLSGLPGAYLVVAIAADWLMLSAGLFGTFAGHTPTRWIWYTISVLGYLTVIYQIGFHGTRATNSKDNQTRRFYGSFVGVALLVKILYPISIAAGPLDLKMNVDGETIFFAIYDIFTQGLLGYWLLIAHNSASGITSYVDGFWSRGSPGEGQIRIEEEGA